MYGYIYLTTNIVNNKKYVGKHKSKKFLGTGYLGSGKALLKAIKKYGKENFKVELLEECYSEDELDLKEKEWIKKFNAVASNEFYNLAYGGEGGAPITNRISINNGIVEIRIFKNEPIPEGFVKGGLTRPGENISKAKKGKPCKTKNSKWYNNGEIQTMAFECPDGFVEGRLPYQNIKKLHWYNNGVSESLFEEGKEPENFVKGMLYHESHIKGRKCYTNGKDHIYLKESDIVPDGYYPGYSEERKLKCAHKIGSSLNKVWYNNGVEEKYFYEGCQPEGWVKGMLTIVDRSASRKKVICVETGIVYESLSAANKAIGSTNINKGNIEKGAKIKGFHFKYY